MVRLGAGVSGELPVSKVGFVGDRDGDFGHAELVGFRELVDERVVHGVFQYDGDVLGPGSQVGVEGDGAYPEVLAGLVEGLVGLEQDDIGVLQGDAGLVVEGGPVEVQLVIAVGQLRYGK